MCIAYRPTQMQFSASPRFISFISFIFIGDEILDVAAILKPLCSPLSDVKHVHKIADFFM